MQEERQKHSERMVKLKAELKAIYKKREDKATNAQKLKLHTKKKQADAFVKDTSAKRKEMDKATSRLQLVDNLGNIIESSVTLRKHPILAKTIFRHYGDHLIGEGKLDFAEKLWEKAKAAGEVPANALLGIFSKAFGGDELDPDFEKAIKASGIKSDEVSDLLRVFREYDGAARVAVSNLRKYTGEKGQTSKQDERRAVGLLPKPGESAEEIASKRMASIRAVATSTANFSNSIHNLKSFDKDAFEASKGIVKGARYNLNIAKRSLQVFTQQLRSRQKDKSLAGAHLTGGSTRDFIATGQGLIKKIKALEAKGDKATADDYFNLTKDLVQFGERPDLAILGQSILDSTNKKATGNKDRVEKLKNQQKKNMKVGSF